VLASSFSDLFSIQGLQQTLQVPRLSEFGLTAWLKNLECECAARKSEVRGDANDLS